MLVQATIAAATAVRATLHPGDALAEDDEIVLDLAPLSARRVATDPGCPAALVAAVGAHPGLQLAAYDAADVAAVLDCGTSRSDNKVPTVRVLAQRTPSWPAGARACAITWPRASVMRVISTGSTRMPLLAKTA